MPSAIVSSKERGLTLIKPFDEPLVIAGQGTVGLEVAEQAAEEGIDKAEILVPCGGGGLTSGIALALAAKAPGIRARPCEPQNFDDNGAFPRLWQDRAQRCPHRFDL